VTQILNRISQRWLQVGYGGALALITVVLGVIAYRMMFSSFDIPDDDGYLLMSLRKFEAGGSLYGDVYSQYGPGVFVLLGGTLRIAGVALTSDGARMVNLALWLASTLLVGLVLLRLTRSFFVSAVGLVVAFLVLQVDANEPLHPGAAIGFLLIALVAAAVFLLPTRERAAMAAIGALAGALLSIKVNVGIFALVSTAFACATTMPFLRERRAVRIVTSTIFVALPFALLSAHLNQAWALRFAGIVSIGALALVLISTRLPVARVPALRGTAALVAGVLAVVAVVSLVPIFGGTSPSQLVDGWFIRPADTPDIQYTPLLVHPWAWVWAALGLAGAIAVSTLWGQPLDSRGHLMAGVVRIAAGLLIWTSLSGPIFDLPTDLTQGMVVGAPLMWIAAIGSQRHASHIIFLRILIPALAALQFLHAYPMPGSQLYWSNFLLVLVVGMCVSDGIDALTAVGMSWRPSFPGWRAIATVSVVAFGVWLGLKPLRAEVRQARANYTAGVSLNLPGAEKMRVPEALADQLQSLVGAIRTHCDTFLTLPGMNSLNIFSGEEPPVELSGPWPFFFTAGEQQRIVEEVKRTPRFCIVRKPDLTRFWAGFSGNSVPQRPLVRFIDEKFRLLHDFSGYRLLIRSS